jgi:uncharacterized membrane protein
MKRRRWSAPGPASARHPGSSAAPATAAPVARWGRAVVLVLAAVYAALFSWLCVEKYRYYLYNDFDLAIFAHALDGVLHGSLFESIRGMNWLGDHSSLILFPLAPLYAPFRDARMLLVLQSVALAAGAWPVYRLARNELEREWAAVCCAALYLMYPALQYSNLFEFHPETLATPALLFALQFMRAGRVVPGLIAAGVALLTREDAALVTLMTSAYALLLRRPGGRRAALGLAAMAVGSLVATYGVLRPLFNAGGAQYGWLYVDWGRTPAEVVAHLLRDPGGAFMALFTSPESAFETTVKQQYYLHMLFPLAFLPLLSPVTLLLSAPIVLGHFLTWRYQQHSIVYHYTALVTPFTVCAAVVGLRNLSNWFALPDRRGAPKAGAAKAPATERKPALAIACGVALACAVTGQALFGPFSPGGPWRRLSPPEPLRPGGEARALQPYRDQLLADSPRAGGVLASFEFLSHLTRLRDVYSLHNLLSGRYTFSNLPYVIPTGVAGMIADFGAAATSDAVLASGGRLRELCHVNGLSPIRAAGDLVAFTRGAGDTVPLVGAGSVGRGATPPLVYDRVFALIDVVPLEREARPGVALEFRVRWMRLAPADRLYFMRLALHDAQGRVVYERSRNVGYGLYPLHEWPAYESVAEAVRMIVPEGLAPGRYDLGFTMEWRTDAWEIGECVVDDPARGAFARVGTIVVR